MKQTADICLILEGTYPYVTGGVSNWAHELIEEHSHLSFHLLAIVPMDATLDMKYTLPANIVSLSTVRLGELPDGDMLSSATAKRLHQLLQKPVASITSEKPLELDDLKTMIDALQRTGGKLGHHSLLDREEAWEQLVHLYENAFENQSFLDYFWSYRAIAGGIFSMLLADLPKAKIYHAMSTGYAGLLAARAKIETGKPVMVTEHGIYTNERRIEVASADWLEATASKSLTIDKPRRDLRDLWIDSINNFSHVCYQACDEIITLFAGNQVHQLEDGAEPKKMRIIANGVDTNRFGRIKRTRQHAPTIALIGRVVPIKDIKTFIRAVGLLKQYVPDVKAYIMGPTDEDADYFEECKTLVQMLSVKENVIFTGRVRIDDYLDQVDVVVLTSLSEAQPLVLLEAGACGIPLVATDVGACREIIEGTAQESAPIGAAGIVTPLANPAATAEAILQLLSNEDFYQTASDAIKTRVEAYYNQTLQHQSYRDLYAGYLANA